MNEISIPKYVPKFLVSLYEAENVSPRGRSTSVDSCRALVAPCHKVGERVVPGAWSDLAEKDIPALRKMLMSVGSSASCGILPERVLSVAPMGFAWWVPAQRRDLLLTKRLAKESGLPRKIQANWPSLLFFSSGGELSVFALKAEARPDGETQAFVPPFWNVQASGAICLGSAPRSEFSSAKEFIRQSEESFFDSEFSHVWGDSQRFRTLSLADGWEAAQEAFPYDELLPCGTVADLLERFDF